MWNNVIFNGKSMYLKFTKLVEKFKVLSLRQTVISRKRGAV